MAARPIPRSYTAAMLKRTLLCLIPLLAAVGPLVLFHAPKWWSQLSAFPTAALAGTPAATSNPAPPTPSDPVFPAGQTDRLTGGEGQPGSATPLAVDSPPTVGMAEAFRFDITPAWVLSRWPRVSAGLAELSLQGYRVPLVTGTAEDDLAGALTYYFNPRQQVQRITFHGTTGNSQRLIQLVVTQYRFGRHLVNNARVFRYEVAEAAGPAKSYLEIRPMQVVKSVDPYRRLEVVLVMERPEG